MAYLFTSGSSQRLSTASTPVTSWPLTIACWFNVINTTTTHTLVSIGNSSAQERFLLIASGTITGDPVRAQYTNNSNIVFGGNTSSAFVANQWTHACGVFTASSRTAYINGGNSGSNTQTPTLSNSGINSVNIGAAVVNSIATGFALGMIADVGIWNQALTPQEIVSLSSGFSCERVRPQNLVFHAPLIRELSDLRGGRTITNINGSTVVDHPRIYT